jgi:hypothetical protein
VIREVSIYSNVCRSFIMVFITNKYSIIYFKIIEKSKSRSVPLNSYTEKHHIIPRSLGGSDSTNNLTRLTAREHFICHWLLTKMTHGSDYQKMIFAFTLMLKCKSTVQERYSNKLTSRLYEKYKIIDADIKKTLYKGRVRNSIPYKFCHIDGRIEFCSILEMSIKHNLLRSSLGHLVKKIGKRHHVKGWSINYALKSIDQKELYKGAGGPKYDSAIYNFIHLSGINESCTKYELFTKYNLPRNGIYLICSGGQESSHGWAVVKELATDHNLIQKT